MSEKLKSARRQQNNVGVVVGAAIVIAVCLFSHLGALGLVGPDEPRYAWIARAMAQTGDWVTPRLYGSPWFEKPILYYWLGAIGFALHLPSEWAARLPSAFAALVAAIAMGWLGWKHYGFGLESGDDKNGGLVTAPIVLAPIVFSTCVAAIGFARAATPDMLFSTSIALAMASAASLLRKAGALRAATAGPVQNDVRVSVGALALFGGFLGLGVLAKGPAAVILASGAIGIWALTTSHFRLALRLAHPISIASFCAVALPWYVLCARRNPDFIRVFIFQHNFERYLTPLFQHKQPFWFFGPITLLAVLPWTPFLVSAALQGREIMREQAWRNSPGFFFACWALFPVLFFSLSQSKLPSYILPAVPPLALILAATANFAFARNRKLAIAISVLIAICWVALGIAAATYFLPDPQAAFATRLILAIVAIVAIVSLVSGFSSNLKSLAFASTIAVAILVEIVGLTLLPNLDPTVSARQRAAWIISSTQPQFYTYRLQRSWNYGLAFYTEHPVEEWSSENPDAASLLTTSQGLITLKKLGRFSGSVNPEERGIRYVRIEPAKH